jgi:hypothetical protein
LGAIVAANLSLKIFVAGAVLMLGLSAPAIAAPRDQECTDCPISNKYDSEEVVEKIKRIKKTLANEEPIDVRAVRADYETGHIRHTARGTKRHARPVECADCAPRRKYDSREVVRKVRDVDHSRVINTRTVVPVRSRIKETNHLVVHDNVVRNTGVVQHNRIIVEKEIRYVRRIPVRTTVEFITHDYRVVERPDSVTVPAYVTPRVRDCRGYGRYGSCRSLLRVRG